MTSILTVGGGNAAMWVRLLYQVSSYDSNLMELTHLFVYSRE